MQGGAEKSSSTEVEMQQKLDELFERWGDAWEKYCSCNPEQYGVTPPHAIVVDGFYPGYLDQSLKILYIGRESHGIDGFNYINEFTNHYRSGVTGCDNININRDRFHKMLIQVAYGLVNHIDSWEEVLSASEICKEKAIFSKISFAFMNLSKLSNMSGGTKVDWQLVETALSMSITDRENFIFEQIEILNPDLIVIMNLSSDCLKRVFPSTLKERKPGNFEYEIEIQGKKVFLLNPYHFSACLSEKNKIYDPLRKACRDFFKR